MTPMSAGYAPIPPGTPWHRPSSAPAGYPALKTTPWGAPLAPLPSPWEAHSPYGRPPPPPPFSPYSLYTPAGFAPGPLPAGPLAWGMPPPGVPPSMSVQHSGFGPRQQQYQAAYDRMPLFTKGPHYVPSLKPMDAYILEADIKINPLISPPSKDGSEQVHLIVWDMIYPSSTVNRPSNPLSKSWIDWRDHPATFPRLVAVNIVSETIPWIFTIHAVKASGVTCGEIIDGIAYNLAKFTSEAEYKSLTPQGRHEVFSAYRHNRLRSPSVHGGQLLGEGMKRLDFLGRRTMFAGIEVNNTLVKKLNSVFLPATFVLKCAVSPPMTQSEMRQERERQGLSEFYTDYPAGGHPTPSPNPQQQQAAAAMQASGLGPETQHHQMAREPYAEAYDRMPLFTKGPHYVPTLVDQIGVFLSQADIDIKVNPLISPLPKDGSEQVHLIWNMVFPSSTVLRSSDSLSDSWIDGRADPATFPPLFAVNIVSENIPWVFTIHASDKAIGVTCGEIIDGIAYNLAQLTSEAEYKSLTQPEGRYEVFSAYRRNRSRSPSVPGDQLGEGMRKLDFLGRRTMFDGVEVNDALAKKINSIFLPATLVLKTC